MFYSLKSNSTTQTVLVLAFKGLDGLQDFNILLNKIEG